MVEPWGAKLKLLVSWSCSPYCIFVRPVFISLDFRTKRWTVHRSLLNNAEHICRLSSSFEHTSNFTIMPPRETDVLWICLVLSSLFSIWRREAINRWFWSLLKNTQLASEEIKLNTNKIHYLQYKFIWLLNEIDESECRCTENKM